MKYSPVSLRSKIGIALVAAVTFGMFARADDLTSPTIPSIATKLLFDPAAPGSQALLTPSGDQVAVTVGTQGTVPCINMTIQPGPAPYPGFDIKPAGASVWDLSAFGHVEAQITNTGDKPIEVSLALYDDTDWKDSHFDGSTVKVGPGETKPLSVVFGYSWGAPGYALKPAQINHLTIYCGKADELETLRVDSIQAAGPHGETLDRFPRLFKTKPPQGVMVGPGVTLNATKQLVATNGSTVSVAADGQSVQIGFDGDKEQIVVVKPGTGVWNLADYLEVRVKIKNTGTNPATPSVRIQSDDGPSDTIAADNPIAPGAESEIVVPFIPRVSTIGANSAPTKYWPNKAGTGTDLSSNTVTGISILSDSNPGAKSLEVTSIVGDVPPVQIPDWLGKRPPVDGDWVQTFDDEFDGNTIDLTKWNIYANNYWDKQTHFSKDNVIVSNGTVKLHYEKKTGHQNDNPAGTVTDYADGNLDTFGKWTQRYGYFEARMKKPKIGGLWPAFWLMPDRGLAAGSEGMRNDTRNGGMEFDVMEFLSGYGPFRHDIYLHWDGYGKDHTQVGTLNIYHTLDKDGYVTSGLLWLPGLAVIYDNGVEVYRWENPRVGNQPSFMLLDMIQGGFNNLNEILDDSKLPEDFAIDYIRVWQRKDLASPVDGPKPNKATPGPPTE